MEQAQRFLEVANKYYEDNKKKWKKYYLDNGMEFDEDVYGDTIIKIYNYLLTHKLEDDSESGFLNYWFRSFNINIKREKQYAHYQATVYGKDLVQESDKQPQIDETRDEKVRRHIFDDWVVIYILQLVEREFDDISFRCFRLYYILPKMTYHKLREVTKIKDCKKRVVTIKKWLKENITPAQLHKKFKEYYDEC